MTRDIDEENEVRTLNGKFPLCETGQKIRSYPFYAVVKREDPYERRFFPTRPSAEAAANGDPIIEITGWSGDEGWEWDDDRWDFDDEPVWVGP